MLFFCQLLFILLVVGNAENNEEREVKVKDDIGPIPQVNLCEEDWIGSKHEETQLVELSHEPNFFSTLYDGFSSSVSTVYNSASIAKDHLYSKASNLTSEFAEKVRTIVKDEFLVLIMDGFTKIVHTSTAPGR